MDSLFTEAALDQELLEIERRKEERARAEAPEKAKQEKRVYSKKLLVIDGYSLIYRSYFAFITHPLTDKAGRNISAYYGFFNTLLMLFRQYKFDYFVVAMDSKGPTFRHEMYKEYKANRDAAPEDLHAEVPLIEETLKKMNIPTVAMQGFEADDLIGTLAKEADKHEIGTMMFTGDKDLLQLVGDNVVALRPPMKGHSDYYICDAEGVKESFGVAPWQIVDYLSLLGDSSDNVPGVKGIGEKSAVKLLEEYNSIDGIYRHLESLSKGLRTKLEEGRESCELSRKLVTIKTDCFSVETFDSPEYLAKDVDYQAGCEDFQKYGCQSLVKGVTALAHKDEKPIAVSLDEERTSSAPKEFLGLGGYKAVRGGKALKAYFEEAYRAGGVIALDTETTSIDLDKAELVGISFSFELKKAYYFPVTCPEMAERDMSFIPVMEEYISSGKLKVIGQNIKYDIEVLAKYGIKIKTLESDTMILSWLLESNQNMHGLEALADRYLSYDALPFDEVVKKGENFSSVPLEDAVRYSAEDSDLTFRLYKYLTPKAEEKGLLEVLRKYELPLIPILADMEAEGIKLDTAFMEGLRRKLSEREDLLSSEIKKEAGHDFNINSTQQLQKVLFEERGLEAGKKTQRGYSTDTATLESLRGCGDRIIDLILEYRGVSKLLSTYVDTLPTLIDKNGRIHTTFLQTGTATGRLSSRNPNLQNIPIRTDDGRLIRNAFIPKDGCVFLSADYSQIELVMLAHISGDAELRKAFTSGEDVHRYTAAMIFEKKPEDIEPKERRVAKTINFGIMYGMSPFRLSNELGISRADAKSFIDRYFERYSGVKDFVAKTVADAERIGIVKTMGGHLRVVPGINSKNRNEKAGGERIAVNTVIQGSAAELMKKAMIAISAEIERRGMKSKILLQVHDELIFECCEDEKEELASLVKEKMENAERLSVPLKASLEFGSRWGEMH